MKAVGKSITRVAVIAMLGAASTLAAASPALATSHNGTCERGEICLYNDSLYHGYHDDNYDSDSNYQGNTYYNTNYSLNDTVTSVYNEAAWQDVTIHSASNYSGAEYTIGAMAGKQDLGAIQFNDVTSSHDF